jgi:hypothetical protein
MITRSKLVRGPGTSRWLVRSDGRRFTVWAHAPGTRGRSNSHKPGPDWVQVVNYPPAVALEARSLVTP